MKLTDALRQLKAQANPDYLPRLEGFGIPSDQALGIRIPVLRQLAREIGRNHELAGQLWAQPLHEAKLLAIFLEEWKKVDRAQARDWVADCYSWDLVDQVVDLFYRHPWALEQATEWRKSEAEFVRRAGLVLMVALTIKQKKWPDADILPFLEEVREVICDNRNFVRKANSWLLRQMGKRSLFLHGKVVEFSREMETQDCPGARWVTSDVLRELTQPAMLERIRAKG